MPTVVVLPCKAKICMYADDHNPPHFNLLGPDTNANVYLENFELYEGKATRVALKEAREWWSSEVNRQKLRDKWKELHERE